MKTSAAVSKEGKIKQKKARNFTGDENQDIYSSFERLVPKQ